MLTVSLKSIRAAKWLDDDAKSTSYKTDPGAALQGIKGLVLVAPAVIAFGFAMPQPAGKSAKLTRDGQSLRACFSDPDIKDTAKKRSH